MLIVPWDPFLMKKLIKNEICGSVNSAQMHCSLGKVNICGYCSCTVHWTVAAFLQKRVKTKQKKKKKKNEKNENVASHKRRRSLSAIQASTMMLVVKPIDLAKPLIHLPSLFLITAPPLAWLGFPKGGPVGI